MLRFTASETPPTVFILDTVGTNQQHIRKQLVAYRQRWKTSLANELAVINNIHEASAGSIILVPQYILNTLPDTKPIAQYHPIASVNALTHYDLRAATINIEVRYTKDVTEAKEWLNALPAVFAYDCEAAKADNIEDIPKVKMALDVFRNQLTMFSFAPTETESFVISNENKEMEDLVLNFLTTTHKKAIMHNASFDMRIVRQRTKNFIKNFEDTQVMWKVIRNHTNTDKALVSLKHLAQNVYQDWAVTKDLFGIEHKYNPELIRYAGIDANATLYLYNEALAHPEFQGTTSQDFPVIPNDLFPIEHPLTHDIPKRSFYNKVAKPLIPTTIDLMLQGIELDPQKIDDLEKTVTSVLAQVVENLAKNPIIQRFQAKRYQRLKADYVLDRTQKQRTTDYYLKPYKQGDMTHRSYLLNQLALTYTFRFTPEALLPTGATKWSIKDVKHLLGTAASPQFTKILQSIIDKTIAPNNHTVILAMQRLAVDKSTLYNEKYIEDINTITEATLLPPFSPGSAQQKQQLFEFLEIPSEAFSKDTGLPSWDRDQVQRINWTTDDPDIKSFTQDFIDHSFSAIISQNFIPAFDRFSLNNTLRGSYKLLGAKTA